MEIVVDTRAMVWEWTSARGPAFGWPTAFAAEFQEAERQGTVKLLIQDWQAHSNVGKALLRDLEGIACSRLPNDERVWRDIFRQALDLISTLLAGIAMIEAHISMLTK
jgi:hypothetical protein